MSNNLVVALVQDLGTVERPVDSIRSILPLGGGHVLVGTSNNADLYASSDSGQSFTFRQHIVPEGVTGDTNSLVSLGNNVILTASSERGVVYRSNDGGQTFTPSTDFQTLSDFEPDATIRVRRIIASGTGSALVCVEGEQKNVDGSYTEFPWAVYRTVDYGLTYTLVELNLYQWNVTAFPLYLESFCILDSNIVLAACCDNKIYRSTNGGQSFTLVATIPADYVLSFLYLGNGVVLVGTGYNGQIYRSSDYGLTYTLSIELEFQPEVINIGVLDVNHLVSLSSEIILAGCNSDNIGGYIYASVDSGQTFTFLQRLGSVSDVDSMALLDNGAVLAGTASSGELYSIINDTNPAPPPPIKLLAATAWFSQNNPASRLYLSADGVTWSSKVVNINSNNSNWIAANPECTVIIVGDRDRTNSVIVSTNGGDSFSNVSLPAVTAPAYADYLWDGGYYNGKFYVISRSFSLIYESVDGLNWSITNLYVPPQGSPNTGIWFESIAGHSGQVVFAGNSSPNGDPYDPETSLYYLSGQNELTAGTVTGVTFPSATASEQGWEYVTFLNGHYLAFYCHTNASTFANTTFVALSDDGINWTAYPFSVTGYTFSTFGVWGGSIVCRQSWHDGTKYYLTSRFEINGSDNTLLLESMDGITWTVAQNLLGVRSGFTGLGDRLFFVDPDAKIRYTDDVGSTWTTSAFDVMPSRNLFPIINIENVLPPVEVNTTLAELIPPTQFESAINYSPYADLLSVPNIEVATYYGPQAIVVPPPYIESGTAYDPYAVVLPTTYLESASFYDPYAVVVPTLFMEVAYSAREGTRITNLGGLSDTRFGTFTIECQDFYTEITFDDFHVVYTAPPIMECAKVRFVCMNPGPSTPVKLAISNTDSANILDLVESNYILKGFGGTRVWQLTLSPSERILLASKKPITYRVEVEMFL